MSSEALAKPIITRNSSEFKLDVYASIPAVELVVFAVQVLQADAAPVAVEEIVSTCFRFFPHSFALKNYFYWPDSALVARRLHDSKEKGLLKGNTADGFETKVQGRQVAKHIAKALGVSLPVRPVVELPKIIEVTVEKKEEEKKEVIPSAPVVEVKKQETQKKEFQGKPKAVKPEKKPAVKKQAAKPKAQAKLKEEANKVVAPVKKKSAPKKTAKQKVSKPTPQPKVTAVKKPVVKVEKKEKRKKKEVRPTPTVNKETVKAAPKPKVEKKVAKKQVTLRLRAGQVSKKAMQPTLKPEIKKVEPKVEKAVEKKQAKKKKEAKASAQPTQLTLGLNPPSAWKKVEVTATKPKLKEEARPVKVEVLAPVAVSKEEKDKAAKVIKQIERSDAYQLYRRNGKRASIGEFDFRNMLFATMESSAETLKRNVELFKRYAGIHFRTDLVAFLEFCEEHFSELLRSKEKKPLRK